MIKYTRKNDLIHSTILKMVDTLRLKCSPFIHFNEYDYPNSLFHGIFNNGTQPSEQLEKEAKEGLQVLFFILSHKF